MKRWYCKPEALEIDLFGVELSYTGTVMEERTDDDNQLKDTEFYDEIVTLWDNVLPASVTMPEAMLNSRPEANGAALAYSWLYYIRLAVYEEIRRRNEAKKPGLEWREEDNGGIA